MGTGDTMIHTSTLNGSSGDVSVACAYEVAPLFLVHH